LNITCPYITFASDEASCAFKANSTPLLVVRGSYVPVCFFETANIIHLSKPIDLNYSISHGRSTETNPRAVHKTMRLRYRQMCLVHLDPKRRCRVEQGNPCQACFAICWDGKELATSDSIDRRGSGLPMSFFTNQAIHKMCVCKF
jgi:hypothetical protein